MCLLVWNSQMEPAGFTSGCRTEDNDSFSPRKRTDSSTRKGGTLYVPPSSTTDCWQVQYWVSSVQETTASGNSWLQWLCRTQWGSISQRFSLPSSSYTFSTPIPPYFLSLFFGKKVKLFCLRLSTFPSFSAPWTARQEFWHLFDIYLPLFNAKRSFSDYGWT